MKYVIAILVFGLFTNNLLAQAKVQPTDSAVVGSITYIADDRVADMYQLYLKENEKEPVVQGYRIQLASGQDRNNINAAKTKFYSKFPTLRPFITYQQPNFKLRVGAYRTKLEAQRMLLEIHQEFGDAFIIRDDIPSKDL